MTSLQVALVADDLTGATDSAVQFAAAGWSAHLLRTAGAPVPRGDGPALLATATGVRAAGADEAAARTAAAVRGLRDRGCDRLYLKVDSTMRGSVAAQLRGARAAWPSAVVLLCPAFPAQGRTVVDGIVLVDGVPLADSTAAHDPVTPVCESRLDALVPGAVPLTSMALTPQALHAGADLPPVLCLDAATDADLDAVAAGVDRLGPRAVAAGSAGLAAALARRWAGEGVSVAAARSPQHRGDVHGDQRVLVAVSSLHPVALTALDRLRALRPAVDVVTTPALRTDAATAAAGFGDRVAALLAQTSYDALVLVGGDGAAATLDRVGATAITLHAALAPGVPVGAVVGGAAQGLRVVTSSGGFGHPGSLVDIIDRLQHIPTQKEPS